MLPPFTPALPLFTVALPLFTLEMPRPEHEGVAPDALPRELKQTACFGGLGSRDARPTLGA